MGNSTAFFFVSLNIFSLAITSLVLFSSFNDGDAAVDRNLVAAQTHDFHLIKVSSMLPDSVCDDSSQGQKLPASSSLKVVHRHGPCHNRHKTEFTQSSSQILSHDESRVDSINSRITADSVENTLTSKRSVTLPAKSGLSLGTGNYVVTVSLGSPKKDLSLVFDTGSSLTWTQCEPCSGYCYNQHDPIFDPSDSTSYTNISCNAVKCKQLKPSGCRGTNCIYGIQYADNSFTVGYLAKDKLTLSPTEIIDDFYFGCGQNNQGLYGQIAGIIGLDRNKFSVFSQASKKYGKVFSYCLPSRSSGSGYLTFGKSVISKSTKYTELTNFKGFYSINIIGIYVAGQKLAISPTVFSTYGSIIDSGTVITRFPLEAYTALRNAFRKQMSAYPMASPLKTLDTCYDFSSYTGVSVPKISIEFGGNKIIDMDIAGIFYAVSLSQVCLAFSTNTGITNLTIYGNVQQKTMQVVYDVEGGRLGFGPNGCA